MRNSSKTDSNKGLSNQAFGSTFTRQPLQPPSTVTHKYPIPNVSGRNNHYIDKRGPNTYQLLRDDIETSKKTTRIVHSLDTLPRTKTSTNNRIHHMINNVNHVVPPPPSNKEGGKCHHSISTNHKPRNEPSVEGETLP